MLYALCVFNLAKRTERALAWPFRGQYRLDQRVVGVGFVFVNPLGFSDIHLTLL